MNVADKQAKVTAYLAAIDALVAREQDDQAVVLAAELLGLLEGGTWAGRVVERDLKPSNVELEEGPPLPCAALTPPVARPAASPRASGAAMDGKARTRRWREKRKAALVEATQQLALVTRDAGVTERDARDVTGVTAVTVTSLSRSSLSPKSPFMGSSGEETLESGDAVTVTRDVTAAVVTVDVTPDGACRSIFAKYLRPGVSISLEDLWEKFRNMGYTFVSGSELRFRWRKWCQDERNDERPVMKDETPAPRPGPRDADGDPEERSRRVEAAVREQQARELVEHRKDHEGRMEGLRGIFAAIESPAATRRAS